jgi:dTDP-4-amino-4,6-dideoxygalactose transaminase
MGIQFNDRKLDRNGLYRKTYPIFGQGEENIVYTFSGKSAIAILLRYFRSTGDLENRADQILVPHWLGSCVYMTMHDYCFPTTTYNSLVKGVFVYHQWGFPQNMADIMDFCKEKGLFCIEDCAHAFKSFYKGKRVGTFGNASLFSLAKFFPCVVGGAIYTENPRIKSFAEDVLKEDDAPLGRKAFNHKIRFNSNPSSENNKKLLMYYAVYDKIFKIKRYARDVVSHDILHDKLQRRQMNYNQYLQEFNGYEFVETFPVDDVMPWVFPLFLKRRYRDLVVKALIENDIESGVYHFDVNRNMLKPDFRKCVPIPCHQAISEDDIRRIIKIVKEAIRG